MTVPPFCCWIQSSPTDFASVIASFTSDWASGSM